MLSNCLIKIFSADNPEEIVMVRTLEEFKIQDIITGYYSESYNFLGLRRISLREFIIFLTEYGYVIKIEDSSPVLQEVSWIKLNNYSNCYYITYDEKE